MADPTSNLAAERAIVQHIASNPGVVDDLLKRSVSRRWFTDPLYASVVEAAVTLRMRGTDINPLSIMAFSTNGVPDTRWQELFEVWGKEAPGKWEDYLEPLQNAVILRDFDEVMADAQRYRQHHSREAKDWLPVVLNGLNGITQGGVYDARPSSHLKQDLRKVVGTLGIPNLDRAMKGGVWDAALAVIGGLSNHGKSTLAYTIACCCVKQKLRTVFITTETLPSEVSVGVARPLMGLSDTQIRERKGISQEWVSQMDTYLSVYDYRFASVEEMDKVLRWEMPQVVIYDFIKSPDNLDSRVPEHRAIAALGEGLRTLANDHRVHIFAFGQFSGSVAERFRRDHNLGEVILFGSARLFHSADEVIIMMRHWLLPETGFFKQKKDRLPDAYLPNVSLIDWEFELKHDPRTRSFYQPA
jgi:archaellum biogenesis ATPase FlaH